MSSMRKTFENQRRFPAAPEILVKNRTALIRLPDEWDLIAMENRALHLIGGDHGEYLREKESGEWETIKKRPPCGCWRCLMHQDLTELIALVRKMRAHQ